METMVVRGRRRGGRGKEEGGGGGGGEVVEVVGEVEARRRVERKELLELEVFRDDSLDAIFLVGSDLSIKSRKRVKVEGGEKERTKDFRAQRESSPQPLPSSPLVILDFFFLFYMAPRKSNKIVSVPVSQPSLDSWISLPGSAKAKETASSSSNAASSSSSASSTSLAALDAELITYSDPLTEKDSIFL